MERTNAQADYATDIRRLIHGALAAAAAFMTAAAGASAADFGVPAPVPETESVVPVPAPVPIPEYANWYLRGDTGWTHYGNPDQTAGGTRLTSEDYEGAWMIGGGIGRYFTESLRGDITVDYRFRSDASGREPASGAVHETAASSTAVLANLYYDFGLERRFRPYAGFGIGVAHNTTAERSIFDGGAQTGFSGGAGSTNFAAAGMAGVTTALGERWMLDAGYRYLYLGDAETEPANDGTGVHGIEDITAHEFRIGLRYQIQ